MSLIIGNACTMDILPISLSISNTMLNGCCLSSASTSWMLATSTNSTCVCVMTWGAAELADPAAPATPHPVLQCHRPSEQLLMGGTWYTMGGGRGLSWVHLVWCRLRASLVSILLTVAEYSYEGKTTNKHVVHLLLRNILQGNLMFQRQIYHIFIAVIE